MKFVGILSFIVLSTALFSESVSEDFEGFDDTPVHVEEKTEVLMSGFDDEMPSSSFSDENKTETHEDETEFINGLTGKVTQQAIYSYNGKKPHDGVTSLRSSLLLDYEYKFENNWRFKVNAKTYYDTIYDLRNEIYTQDELDQFQSEVRLYDAYIEGSLSENIDLKVGRQVVVWGRSDTIRITDILNPLDNRRPAIVDIEDLRLPVSMVKMDFFVGDWRITPIAIVEQFFSINPAFGSAFNPLPNPNISEKSYTDVTYALSIGAEFTGWDVNFYAARVRDDAGYIKFSPQPTFTHEKVNMLGTALNVIRGSWLLKTELAYFDGLKYTSTQDKTFRRTDALLGVEYNGIADTMISYDISLRYLNNYDSQLQYEFNPLEKETYQQAFRISTDLMNDTVHLNYLISLFGKKLDEGGFQRGWVEYDIADALSMNVGVVDYIGGSVLFDTVKGSDMIFVDVSYSF